MSSEKLSNVDNFYKEFTMLNERIKHLRKSLNLTQEAFGAKLEVTQATVVEWERGRTSPSIQVFNKLAENLNINLHWLMTGVGSMYMPFMATDSQQRELRHKVFNFIRSELTLLENSDSLIPPKETDYWYLPISGEIAAGDPIPFNEDIEPINHVPILKKILNTPAECDVLRVNGNSMEPKIEHSDLVVIKRSNDWAGCNYKVVAARVDGGITLKKLQMDPEKRTAYLIPFNPAYPFIPIDEDVELCGYLILLVRHCSV
jgi:SOS-response transcriptional repressor LexA